MKLNERKRLLLLATGFLLTFGNPSASFAQEIVYLSDEEALALEHDTRFTRLERLAKSYAVSPAPEFQSYTVPRELMPADFKYDVPVLRIIFPENTFFDTGSSTVKPSALAIISAMAAMIDRDVPEVSLFVAGHTDSRGSEVFNHNLSIARARAVGLVLENETQRPDAVWTIGFGESIPLYPNTEEKNMAWNRRVEFLIASRPDAIAYWLQDQAVDVCRTNDPVARVRCMTDFQQGRREFVAERAVVSRVQPKQTAPRRTGSSGRARARQNSGNAASKAPVAGAREDKIVVYISDGNRIRVRSIEK